MSIIRLTNNIYADTSPQIYGNTIVWRGYDGSDYEIFYSVLGEQGPSTPVNISNNTYPDAQGPQIYSDTVVWYEAGSSDSGIYYSVLGEGGPSAPINISNNTYGLDYSPQIYGNTVVWSGRGSNGVSDIFYSVLGAGGSNAPINISNNPNNYGFVTDPKIYSNAVVWTGFDGSDSEIFYSVLGAGGSSAPINISNNTYNDASPQIYGNTLVWMGHDGSDSEIFYSVLGAGGPSAPINISNNIYYDSDPQIYGNTVVWTGGGGSSDSEIFYSVLGEQGPSTPVNISNNSYGDSKPQIYGNTVVWTGYVGSDYEIFYSVLGVGGPSAPIKITENAFRDPGTSDGPQIYGNTVVWTGGGGNDNEIFAAQITDLPTITFDIESKGNVIGGDPDGKLLDGVDRNVRKVGFDLISYDGNDELRQSWNKSSKPVWIVSHGWNSNPNASNISGLTSAVKSALSGADGIYETPDDTGIVLAFDWSEAANTGKNIYYPDPDELPDNGKAASWIKSVAEYAAKQLKDWGLNDGSQINLIGHSLGSILSAEIASYFGKVNSIIALEPPSDNNLPGDQGQDPSKYDIAFDNEDSANSGRQAPKRFTDVSTFSRAFVGSRSIAADATYAATAQESILMDFGQRVDTGQEHGWVIDTFANLITTNSLANNLFSLGDNSDHSNFRDDSYLTWELSDGGVLSPKRLDPKRVFEGVIRVDQPSAIVSFTARKQKSGSADELLYGTNLGSSLNGGLGNDDLFGGAGNDILTGDAGNDILTGDAGNDTLLGGTGNDILRGGAGNDILTGGAGYDQFWFDIGRPFNSTMGIDTVTDFVPGTDRIVLDKTTFAALRTSANSTLNNTEFAVINRATKWASLAGAGSSSASIVFNLATGDLFYNPNGSTAGLGSGGLFANLAGVTTLFAADISVVS